MTDTAVATEAEAATDEAGGKKKKGKRKLLLIVGALVVVGIGAFFGLRMFGGGDEAAGEAADAEESEPPSDGEVLELDTITTVVGGDGDLARVSLALVLTEDAVADTVSTRLPLVKDAAVREVARSRSQELRTPEGADDLRVRLKKQAGEIYPDGEVMRVLITELVVQ